MNSEEAKRILQVYRPGGRDAVAPEFGEALALVEGDPELARWFNEQRSFDAAISRSLQEEPVPADLRRVLMSLGPSAPVTPWWREPVRLAWAAAILLLVGLVGGIYAWPSTLRFAEFRQQLIDRSWDHDQHLQLLSSDLGEIRVWLRQQNAPADFIFPAGLKDMTIRGCRVVECNGKRASQLCLLSGSRHTHFFVLDRVVLPDWPDETVPQYAKCAGWKTVSWSDGQKLYLVSGMKIWSFVKRFRHDGHWAWTG